MNHRLHRYRYIYINIYFDIIEWIQVYKTVHYFNYTNRFLIQTTHYDHGVDQTATTGHANTPLSHQTETTSTDNANTNNSQMGVLNPKRPGAVAGVSDHWKPSVYAVMAILFTGAVVLACAASFLYSEIEEASILLCGPTDSRWVIMMIMITFML